MAQITVNGQKVNVGDNFFTLSPEQQDATVDEIARSMPKPATPAAPADIVNTMVDVAKGTGSGLVRGAAIYAGQGGDINDMLGAGMKKEKAAGVPVDDIRKQALEAMPSWLRKYHEAPLGPSPVSSQAIMKKVDEVTDLPVTSYQPDTFAGRAAQTAATFAVPAAATGIGPVRGALMPGVVSEAARTLAEGTGYEAPAAIAGAVLGGSVLPARHLPTAANMRTVSNQQYNSPVVRALRINPQATESLGVDIAQDAFNQGFRQGTAPQAFRTVVEELGRPMAEGRAATVSDLVSAKGALRRIVEAGTDFAGRLNPDATVASQAIRRIDQYLANVPANDVVGGNAAAAGNVLRDAQGNWGAYRRSGDIDRLVQMAEHRAGSTYSGGNVNNATRQNLRKLLDSPKRTAGYTAEERAALERAVLGTRTGNALRYLGRRFGAHGPLGSLATIGSGSAAGGLSLASGQDPGTAATVALLAGLGLRGGGAVARGLGNASQARQAQAFRDLVASRAPLAHDPQALAALGINPTTRYPAVIQALVALENSQRQPQTIP